MRRIVLMGFMGAGKTTVGRRLAKMLSCEFVDTDERIEKEQGRKISEIFEKNGEQFFRDLETELLKRLLEDESYFVLSIGGGMPLREENRELLQKIGRVVYLKASRETIVRRVAQDSNRPLLFGGSTEEKVASLMNAREEIYRKTAQMEIETDNKTPEEIVGMIIL